MATTTKKADAIDTTLEWGRSEVVLIEELNRWSAPAPMTPSAEVDLRVGGRYRIVMRGPDGADRIVAGVYRTIERPSKLAYTWKWDESPMPDSLVTVEFHDRGKSTEVVLRHEGLIDAESRARHEHGWTGCLENLVSIIGSKG